MANLVEVQTDKGWRGIDLDALESVVFEFPADEAGKPVSIMFTGEEWRAHIEARSGKPSAAGDSCDP
jgi:hypothetical protein